MRSSFGLAVIALLVLVNPVTFKKVRPSKMGESVENVGATPGLEFGEEEEGDGDGIEPAPDYVPPEPFVPGAQKRVGLEAAVGANTLVNSRDLCGGRGNTQSETKFAVYGDVIVAAFNDSRGFYCPNRSTVGWAYSLDGGASFTDGGTLPGGLSVWSNGDPWVVATQDGTFFVSGISHNFVGMSVSRGTITEDGISWGDPVQATFGSSGTDKEALAYDPTTDFLYMVYDVNTARVELVRSEDRGDTWTTPRVLPFPAGIGAFPVIDAGGRIYVFWNNGWPSSSERMLVSYSDDYGDTFSSPVVIAPVCAFNVPGFSRGSVPAFPSVAIDQSGLDFDGRLYLTYHSGCQGPGNAFLTYSDDGGLSWSEPGVVPDDDSGGIHFSPTVSVDANGTVNVFFYDRRDNPGTGITNVYFAQSFDGGDTFEPNILVTEVATNWSATASDITPNMGDYMSSASVGTDVLVNWSDGRSGDPDSYFARISAAKLRAK